MPLAKLELLGRALNRSPLDDGALTFSHVPPRTSRDRRGGELHRGHRRPPALARHQGGGACCSSAKHVARAQGIAAFTDGTVDVRAIARRQGGGGHRRAAGFSTDMSVEEIVAFLRGALAEQLG